MARLVASICTSIHLIVVISISYAQAAHDRRRGEAAQHRRRGEEPTGTATSTAVRDRCPAISWHLTAGCCMLRWRRRRRRWHVLLLRTECRGASASTSCVIFGCCWRRRRRRRRRQSSNTRRLRCRTSRARYRRWGRRRRRRRAEAARHGCDCLPFALCYARKMAEKYFIGTEPERDFIGTRTGLGPSCFAWSSRNHSTYLY